MNFYPTLAQLNLEKLDRGHVYKTVNTFFNSYRARELIAKTNNNNKIILDLSFNPFEIKKDQYAVDRIIVGCNGYYSDGIECLERKIYLVERKILMLDLLNNPDVEIKYLDQVGKEDISFLMRIGAIKSLIGKTYSREQAEAIAELFQDKNYLARYIKDYRGDYERIPDECFEKGKADFGQNIIPAEFYQLLRDHNLDFTEKSIPDNGNLFELSDEENDYLKWVFGLRTVSPSKEQKPKLPELKSILGDTALFDAIFENEEEKNLRIEF